MGYGLGVDVGTTFTAAAVCRDGRAEPVTLGTNGASVPSVIYLDGERLVVGEAAQRRAVTEPSRVAREFKRRVGDPTPLMVGASPMAPELLMARVLAWVVAQVTKTEGGPPDRLVVTHPANWGDYKLDLVDQAARHVGLDVHSLVPEPVAAATFYATQRDLPAGTTVAVYDLGGGTFDAAVLRAGASGFEIVGRPEGIEHLGGVDFDHAVLRHVTETGDIDLDALDPEDAGLAAALAQLRHECVTAKEALSSETEVTIPVMLPTGYREVRLTRSEFETMIRPALRETLVALRRAIASADVTPTEISSVLLVGGSSRIPLVSQLITAELNLPTAVDARPKDAIALGAALAATVPPARRPLAPAPAPAAAGASTTPRPGQHTDEPGEPGEPGGPGEPDDAGDAVLDRRDSGHGPARASTGWPRRTVWLAAVAVVALAAAAGLFALFRGGAEPDPQLAVTPRTGAAGTVVEIVGDGCPPRPNGASDNAADGGVVAGLAPNGDGPVTVEDNSIPLDPGSAWSTRLRIPDGTSAGSYTIFAQCGINGADSPDGWTYYSYPSTGFEVTEP